MPNSLKCKIKHLCHNGTITERERDRLLKALEQESKWIPVSERLPKDGGDYLVTIAFDIGDKEPVREVKKDYFCILSKKWLYENENIIAWMPLPEPYKEESKTEQSLAYADQDTLMSAT